MLHKAKQRGLNQGTHHNRKLLQCKIFSQVKESNFCKRYVENDLSYFYICLKYFVI